MIPLKTDVELDIMRENGRILARILRAVCAQVAPGVNTASLNRLAEEMIGRGTSSPSISGWCGTATMLIWRRPFRSVRSPPLSGGSSRSVSKACGRGSNKLELVTVCLTYRMPSVPSLRRRVTMWCASMSGMGSEGHCMKSLRSRINGRSPDEEGRGRSVDGTDSEWWIERAF